MMDTTAPADTDIDEQVARAKSLADYELRQAELRNQQIIEGVRQEAVSALLKQEQNTHNREHKTMHKRLQRFSKLNIKRKVSYMKHNVLYMKYKVQGKKKGKRERW